MRLLKIAGSITESATGVRIAFAAACADGALLRNRSTFKGSPMPALGRALIDALRDHGAREIFGIPGDFVLPRKSISRRVY